MKARYIFALLCLLLLSATPAQAFDCSLAEQQWSDTQPPVNLTHLFCGEVNRAGKAVGYHATLGDRSEGEARIERLLLPRDRHGVYAALVCRDDAPEQACKRSTLFPDELSQAQVLAVVLQAYEQREWLDRRGKWCGPSDLGYAVEGWLLPDREAINTAWPARGGC